MAKVQAAIRRVWNVRPYESLEASFLVEQDVSDDRLIAECKQQNATSAVVLAKLGKIQFEELHKLVLVIQNEIVFAPDPRDALDNAAVGHVSSTPSNTKARSAAIPRGVIRAGGK